MLQVGMRLLEVNGISLLGASHQEAVNVLRNSGNEITLVVCKGKQTLRPVNSWHLNFSKTIYASYEFVLFSGYDKAEVDRLLTEGKLSRESKSVSQSVSSLDRDDEDTTTLRQARDIFYSEMSS